MVEADSTEFDKEKRETEDKRDYRRKEKMRLTSACNYVTKLNAQHYVYLYHTAWVF